MLLVEAPSAILLGLAALLSAAGGIVSTILGARRARDAERQACEEQLRALRLEAGDLADQLYRLKAHKEG